MGKTKENKKYTNSFFYLLLLLVVVCIENTKKNQPRENTCGFEPNAMNSSGKIHRNMKTRENNHKTMYAQNEMRRLIGHGIPLAKCVEHCVFLKPFVSGLSMKRFISVCLLSKLF